MGEPKSQTMRPQDILVFEDEETSKTKLSKAVKDYPLMFVGLTGALAALTYSFSRLRKRDKRLPLSMYLIHTRLAVQGTFVTSLVIMTTWNFYRKRHPKEDKP